LPVTTDAVAGVDLNTWGLGVGLINAEPTTWRAVSSTPLNLDALGTDGSKTTHLYYAAKMNFDKPACQYYEGTVIITAVISP
jgi:hypothetical protein